MKGMVRAVATDADRRNRVDERPRLRASIAVMLLRALALSIGQLGDRVFLAVLAKSLAVTIVIVAGLAAGGWFAARAAARWMGATAGWDALAGAAALVAALLAGWLLFRAVAVAVIGLFADDIVAAVEARHYPDRRATARDVSVARGAAMGLRSAGRVVLVNIALSPLYLLLLVTGVGTAALFFVANGWLLGRDLFDMVAVRHVDGEALARLHGATRARRMAMGLGATALFVVPGVNLLAPILGAALATHYFHMRLYR